MTAQKTREKEAQQYAAIIQHNKDAREALRLILSEKYKKGDTASPGYKSAKDMFEAAERNIDKYTWLLGELNARVLQDGTLEIY